MRTVVVVPAFRPGPEFVPLVRRLVDDDPAVEVLIVDDGSGEAHRAAFEAAGRTPRTRVLRHAVNLGKGAALKSAFHQLALDGPSDAIVVTADADGQHLPEDIRAVARRAAGARDALVLGVRSMAGEVPLRSRVGNRLTRALLRLLVGLSLSDTQTGLRAVPPKLRFQLLGAASNRYEFELDMLLLARKLRVPIEEVPISTVYIDDNRGSHFDPLFDSMRIYLVLFRSVLAALLSAAVDFTIFWAVFAASGRVGLSQVVARSGSLFVNFAVLRSAVFHDRGALGRTFALYLALVAVSGLASYGLILLFVRLGLPVLGAKPLAETLVYLGNFAVQRDFIFRARPDLGGEE